MFNLICKSSNRRDRIIDKMSKPEYILKRENKITQQTICGSTDLIDMRKMNSSNEKIKIVSAKEAEYVSSCISEENKNKNHIYELIQLDKIIKTCMNNGKFSFKFSASTGSCTDTDGTRYFLKRGNLQSKTIEELKRKEYSVNENDGYYIISW